MNSYQPLSVATCAFCLTATQQKDILVIMQIDFILIIIMYKIVLTYNL